MPQRRKFLKNLAALGAAPLAGAAFARSSSSDKTSVHWDEEFDVIVVGSAISDGWQGAPEGVCTFTIEVT